MPHSACTVAIESRILSKHPRFLGGNRIGPHSEGVPQGVFNVLLHNKYPALWEQSAINHFLTAANSVCAITVIGLVAARYLESGSSERY